MGVEGTIIGARKVIQIEIVNMPALQPVSFARETGEVDDDGNPVMEEHVFLHPGVPILYALCNDGAILTLDPREKPPQWKEVPGPEPIREKAPDNLRGPGS